MTNPKTGLSLNALTIIKDGHALVEIDTHVEQGGVLTVMGPSGSGKSTLLSTLIGTLAPAFHTTGQIVLNGRDITQAKTNERHIGILFQDHLLFPHMSAGQNLAFGLQPDTTRAGKRQQIIEDALEDIGLSGFAHRDPATLSGGQKARIALMRVLLSEPEALLLDEPFSGLDTELRDQIRTLVFERAKARGLPIVLVTHDIEDAQAAGQNIVRIGQHP